MADLDDLALKSVYDMPQMNHIKFTDEILRANGGKAPKGALKYSSLADASSDFPEIIMMEDLLNGLLKGTSFGNTNVKCQSSMQGVVYYTFEAINNRDVTNPTQIVKLTIAAQKLQEQGAIFYA